MTGKQISEMVMQSAFEIADKDVNTSAAIIADESLKIVEQKLMLRTMSLRQVLALGISMGYSLNTLLTSNKIELSTDEYEEGNDTTIEVKHEATICDAPNAQDN